MASGLLVMNPTRRMEASDELAVVHLHIYDLSQGMAQAMSAAFLGKSIPGIWHTGIVVYGREYFFGGGGVQSCPPGGTVLGRPHQIHRLGETQIPHTIFYEYLQGLSESVFRAQAYDLFNHNCNNFSNEVAVFLCGITIPQHILDLPAEVLNTPLGQSLKPFLAGLTVQPDSVGTIPVYSGSRPREPSPGEIELEAAIEEARRESLALEERRSSIIEKIEKRERKKKKHNKKHHSHKSNSEESGSNPGSAEATPSSSPRAGSSLPPESASTSFASRANRMAEDAVAALTECEQEQKKPREPPIIFKDAVDIKTEFEALVQAIEPHMIEDDAQALDELKQYVIDDEGSWALGDNFLSFIARILEDPLFDAHCRVKLLNVLAVAALKDDVILILHQDRRDHVIMNFAHKIDRLSKDEQEAVALLICNLFTNTNTSEWLLYISEWAGLGSNSLSNIRVTTKVAVTALLADTQVLQDRGSAIMHNLATKEVKTVKISRSRDFASMLPQGALNKVFDDVATELAMAILQFFVSSQPEEWVYRCMTALLRFAYLGHSEVPALIKMIGPDPAQFKGMSQRVDEIIEPLCDRLRSVRGFD